MAEAEPHIRLFREHAKPCVVALGKFDGVHEGHLAVLERARREGVRRGLPLVVITFDRRPECVMSPDAASADLMSLSERVQALHRAGADEVVVLEFTPELARRPADAFARDLVEELGMAVLCAGEDFAFGRDRRGDIPYLRGLGLEVIAVPLVLCPRRGLKLSSTLLREERDVRSASASESSAVLQG